MPHIFANYVGWGRLYHQPILVYKRTKIGQVETDMKEGGEESEEE